MLDLFIKLFIFVAVILYAVTAILAVNGHKKLKNYNECTGVIVKFCESTSPVSTDFGEKAISPVVSYTVGVRSYEFIGNYCSTSMKVGQEIKVLYNKENPAKATIKTGLYVAPIITGALALLFTLPIIIYAVLKSKGIINI